MPARCQFLGIKFIGDYRFKLLPSIIESDKGFLKTFHHSETRLWQQRVSNQQPLSL